MIERIRQRLFPKPPLGTRGERLAAKHLKRHRYRILARNVRNRFGEIDLIAQPRDNDNVVVFVEVKSGIPSKHPPELRVNQKKQHRIVALSAQILRQYHLENKQVRYDVIAIDFPPEDKPVIRHHIAAFESHV